MPDDELTILVNLIRRLITKTAMQSSCIVPTFYVFKQVYLRSLVISILFHINFFFLKTCVERFHTSVIIWASFSTGRMYQSSCLEIPLELRTHILATLVGM